MMEVVKPWRHVFKLDPERELGEDALEAVCMSGTDAIMIGGSSGVTYDNTVDLMSRVRRYELPCVLEVSDLEAVVPGFDLYMIPMVLNTTDSAWTTGRHREAIERYGYLIPWEALIPEGYIVLNPDSTVARLTGADTDLSLAAAEACAHVGSKLMNLPVIYVEYSGTFGDLQLVERVRRASGQARVFYGGGIRDRETAAQAASVSDTIVVGNIIYENLTKALETVEAVHNK
ncbi:heptaprenylglyceryl phosphate synthase [Paenibacillus sp. P96]|uniref:Heptaprenylglyceryl phosphate synthase n=1 Tax=Paenibacillus zeirhizosphaerae TaxID=2987519 RepID=A0ABT9FQ10_9BACL|nr:heptaprenylglyceryl phosphate synthase [Paenibacillus sp. P96]MDP4096522.1 heptaprenylglyceryl phosphate synthase [Paenibacillus sp. P96]